MAAAGGSSRGARPARKPRLRPLYPALASLAALLLLGGTAQAHSPIPGVGVFYNGMLHPLLLPAHALVLVAVGLLCGQHAPRVSRAALPAFALALGAGLALPPPLSAPDAAIFLLGLGALAGAAVALGAPLRPLMTLLAAVAGLAVGLDSRADAPGPLPLPEAGGIWLGAVLAVVLVGGAAASLTRAWQRIGLRALGSWIAAAAILVLMLSLGGVGAGAGTG